MDEERRRRRVATGDVTKGFIEIWEVVRRCRKVEVNPVEFFRELSEATEAAEDRRFRRKLLETITGFLIAAFSGTLLLLALDAASLIVLPDVVIERIAYTLIAEIAGLMGVIVANLCKRM
jgi:hypothetical protein